MLVLVLTLIVVSTATAVPASAPKSPDKVPVLIVDSGLGDNVYLTSHWLGEEQEVAASGPFRLLTSPAPVWWRGAGFPDTYVLTSSVASGSVGAAPVRPEEIAWALDQVAERHPEGKAFLVGQGAAGLQARAYLEDLGAVKQSSRADVVGLVLVGTPNGGLELAERYPMLDVWAPVAAGVGLNPTDLLPGSTFLTALDAGRMPGVLHTLVVQGSAVELADRNTDGVTVLEASALASGVAQGPLDMLRVRASASQGWPLSKSWFAVTRKGGQSADPVDETQVALLQSASSYAMSEEVAAAVKKFYTASLTDGAPTTHISTRLLMDVSGSMAGKLSAGTKLDTAKQAAKDFTESLAARQALSGAVPEDIGLVTFNESASVIAPGGTSPAKMTATIGTLKAKGNTDVGKALAVVVGSFAGSPKPADKVVVFLSDGVNTAGLDEKGILAGPVKTAENSGIRIETIALGGVGTADVEFLKQIASATGGSFHQAKDLFELRRDFLRARYTSIGKLVVDQDVDTTKVKQVELGKMDASVQLLEIAAISNGGTPSWQLTRDGKPVAATELALNTNADGATSLAITKPAPGTYALAIANDKGTTRAHVFAVKQVEAFVIKTSAAPPDNSATLVLIVVGAIVLLAVIGTMVMGVSARRSRRAGDSSEGTSSGDGGGSYGGSSTDDGGQ